MSDFISSRTPEGSPNRCPVCGSRIRIEPSQPPGDAPCPACGTLLWFKVGDTLYWLIAEGRGLERRLQHGEEPQPAHASGSFVALSRDQERLLQKLLSSPAWHKYRENRQSQMNFADAVQFWGLTENMTVDALDNLLEQLRFDLSAIEALLGIDGTALVDGVNVRSEKIGSILDTHVFLERRFARHLKLLRSRGGAKSS